MNLLNGVRLADRDIEFIECELKARLYRGKIRKFLQSEPDNEEYRKIADYLSAHKPEVFPCEYRSEYSPRNITAVKDRSCGMIYIVHNGKKIYMRRKYTSLFRARFYFNNILTEQDPRSPHRYTTPDFEPEDGSIIIDIGGAEGFFPLEYIERAKAVYIFETDTDWCEALRKTYAGYEDKVFIVNKFVSDQDTDRSIRLDTFIEENSLNDEKLFIKIDAEGSEPCIINGAERILNASSDVRLAVCCYHGAGHERMIRSRFGDSWEISHSDGFMLYYYDYDFYEEPYVRRGVLRIKKN